MLRLIQLKGVGTEPLGLYQYNDLQYSVEDAIAAVEQAVETAYQKEEAGELEHIDVQTEADEQLEKIGIERTHAEEAFTDRL